MLGFFFFIRVSKSSFTIQSKQIKPSFNPIILSCCIVSIRNMSHYASTIGFWMLTLTLESRFCSFLDSRLFFSTKSTYCEEQTVVWDDAMLGWWRLWPVGKQIGLDVCTAGRSSENDHSKCCKSFSVKNEGSTVPNPTAQNLIFGQF